MYGELWLHDSIDAVHSRTEKQFSVEDLSPFFKKYNSTEVVRGFSDCTPEISGSQVCLLLFQKFYFKKETL